MLSSILSSLYTVGEYLLNVSLHNIVAISLNAGLRHSNSRSGVLGLAWEITAALSLAGNASTDHSSFSTSAAIFVLRDLTRLWIYVRASHAVWRNMPRVQNSLFPALEDFACLMTTTEVDSLPYTIYGRFKIHANLRHFVGEELQISRIFHPLCKYSR